MNTTHIEKSLDIIKRFFGKASEIIDALKPDEKVTATGLAETIGAFYCRRCLCDKPTCESSGKCPVAICKKCAKAKEKKQTRSATCFCDVTGFESIEGPSIYPVLKILIDDYPDVEVTKGAYGGIRKKKPTTAAKLPPAPVASVPQPVSASEVEETEEEAEEEIEEKKEVTEESDFFEKEPLSIKNT